MRNRPDVTANVGGRDRALRLIVGVALLALAFSLDIASGWRLAAYLISVAALLTALARYCPFNAALGLDTRRHRSRSPS
jgi:tetrahydromethanopterin S-methyltransferase subunit C